MTFLNPTQENSFIYKLENSFNLSTSKVIHINDSLLSKRRITSISNEINDVINSIEEGQFHYFPLQFNYKQSGDQKHRLALLITTDGTEIFDPNGFEDNLTSNNKQNLIHILDSLDSNVFKYNNGLNTLYGKCVTLSLLFILFRVNGLSINDVCEVFSSYEQRININYEKAIDKLIKKKVMDWEEYHNLITRLIN